MALCFWTEIAWTLGDSKPIKILFWANGLPITKVTLCKYVYAAPNVVNEGRLWKICITLVILLPWFILTWCGYVVLNSEHISQLSKCEIVIVTYFVDHVICHFSYLNRVPNFEKKKLTAHPDSKIFRIALYLPTHKIPHWDAFQKSEPSKSSC